MGPATEAPPPGRRAAAGLMLALYAAFFYLTGLDALSYERPPSKDAAQYVIFAWNLSRHGVFSIDEEREGKTPAPSAYREPGYPAFLALGILLAPGLGDLDLEGILGEEAQPRLWLLKHMQVMLHLATSLLAMGLARLLTGSRPLSWLALVLVGFDAPLHAMSNSFLSEPLIVFLLTALSVCLVLLALRPAYPLFGGAGFLLALLALTRAAFYFFWIPAALLMGILILKLPRRRRRLLAGLLIFLASFFAPVGAWMARNHHHFGRAFIAERGGMILAIRAEMNMMTRAEYLASFLSFSNSRFLRDRLMPSLLGEDAAGRLDPENPEGFVQVARRRRTELNQELKDRARADTALFQESLGKIARHPFRHLLATLPLGLRGVYVERTAALSLALWLFFLGAFLSGLARRDAAALAALAPAVLSYAFHSFLTHNIPRYNATVIPLLWVGALLWIRWKVEAWTDRPRGE